MQPFRKSLPMPNVCADIDDDDDGTTYGRTSLTILHAFNGAD